MAIAAACLDVLKSYILNPWQWPRESDVVCHLVTDIKTRLTPPNAAVQITRHTAPISGAFIPRVRTEVKINGMPPWKIKGASPWKIDVCVQTPGPNDVYVGRGGIRDVLLTVSPNQLEEVVEVKLNPGRLYTGWVDDLVKLHMIREQVCGHEICKLKSLHGLFIDTSLFLPSLGHNSSKQSTTSPAKHVPVWPLNVVGSIGFDYPRNGAKWHIDLELCSEIPGSESEPQIYLWAIGLKNNAAPANILAGEAIPACWKVTVEKIEDV